MMSKILFAVSAALVVCNAQEIDPMFQSNPTTATEAITVVTTLCVKGTAPADLAPLCPLLRAAVTGQDQNALVNLINTVLALCTSGQAPDAIAPLCTTLAASGSTDTTAIAGLLKGQCQRPEALVPYCPLYLSAYGLEGAPSWNANIAKCAAKEWTDEEGAATCQLILGTNARMMNLTGVSGVNGSSTVGVLMVATGSLCQSDHAPASLSTMCSLVGSTTPANAEMTVTSIISMCTRSPSVEVLCPTILSLAGVELEEKNPGTDDDVGQTWGIAVGCAAGALVIIAAMVICTLKATPVEVEPKSVEA
eukprot:TRINITY_DN65738_c0_g1_i1.p1 TRINITY_DN65738_c0_g1~~TRINITY_DN65738_c0_g1_i1.p1  ORF type:complete len:307 (+),score=97.83 TRINITY_DN65738_c0_g1_i1:195-1115(+)